MTWAHLRVVGAVSLALAVSACGDGEAAEGADTGTGSETGTTTGSESATTTGDDPDTSGSPEESESGDDGPVGQCILWELDECGVDQKCMPWSLNDDRTPDEIRCCAAAEDPDLEGEPCEIQDYDGSCLDSCGPGTMCVLDDVDTLGGQCQKFCQPGGNDCGTEQTCKTFFELLPLVPNVPLCMDQCDPLVQDCDLPNWMCIPDSPTTAGQSGFICVSPPPQAPIGLLGECGFANDCEKGLVCVSASRLPNCSAASCCTAYCENGEGDASCTAIDPGLSCVDWMSPEPKWEHVGVCAIPE